MADCFLKLLPNYISMQELVVHLINLHPKLFTNITPTRSLFINNCDLHMQLTGGLLVPRGLNVNVYIHIHVYIVCTQWVYTVNFWSSIIHNWCKFIFRSIKFHSSYIGMNLVDFFMNILLTKNNHFSCSWYSHVIQCCVSVRWTGTVRKGWLSLFGTQRSFLA